MRASVDILCHPDRSVTLVFQADDLVDTQFFKIPSDFFININYQVCTVPALPSHTFVYDLDDHYTIPVSSAYTHSLSLSPHTPKITHTLSHSALSPPATPAASRRLTNSPTTR